jgi:cAMP phosphodiesterase
MSLRDLVAQDLAQVLAEGDLSESAMLASSTGLPFALVVVVSAGAVVGDGSSDGGLSLPQVTHTARGLEAVISEGFATTTGVARLPSQGDLLTVRGEVFAVLHARRAFGGAVLMSLVQQRVGALGGAWRPA